MSASIPPDLLSVWLAYVTDDALVQELESLGGGAKPWAQIGARENALLLVQRGIADDETAVRQLVLVRGCFKTRISPLHAAPKTPGGGGPASPPAITHQLLRSISKMGRYRQKKKNQGAQTDMPAVPSATLAIWLAYTMNDDRVQELEQDDTKEPWDLIGVDKKQLRDFQTAIESPLVKLALSTTRALFQHHINQVTAAAPTGFWGKDCPSQKLLTLVGDVDQG